jgi:7,8-dihydropterin-6-yl-methyl-4-(beta-D-ribofuranosyl)aminobenzene 5'-phosphate synthase
MSTSIRLTCLINDTPADPALPAELGLAFLLQTADHNLLFDTGQTGLVVPNARQLGLDLSTVDRVVLSHGHYDHTGGLHALLDLLPPATLFAHPAAFDRKFSHRTGAPRDIGIPRLTPADLARRDWNIVHTLAPTEILPGIHCTGPVPRLTPFEDTGGTFSLDPAAAHPDPLLDDQALFFPSAQGIVVLLGCAHAGIINTLRYIQTLTRPAPLHAVIGGTHLLNAAPARRGGPAEALHQLNPQLLAPCHCTGTPATTLLRSHFPASFHPCAVGTHFSFQL